ncbi:MAG: GTP-binding protein [Bacteroidota bacterium]
MSTNINPQATAVTILTGFLGAGKTTYLNHLLQRNSDIRYAIIENEYGEQSIDSDLIIRAEDGIVELNNGCLCCTLNDNLYDILNTLFDRRDEYDEIIIEATGVADPTGLAEPFVIHPAVKKQFPLSGIICLVDAELIFDQLEQTKEAISQIAYSDVLLVNKIDLVSEVHLKDVTSHLKKLNPLAQLAFGQKDDFPDFDTIHQSALFDAVRAKSKVGGQDVFPVSKPHHHHHHHHTEEVVSHTVVFEQPFDGAMLRHRLFAYMAFQSQGLYRMKGLLYLDGSDEQHLLQSVGKRFDISEKRPWEAGEKRQSTIVFIGKNIGREGLEKMLSQCLSKKTVNKNEA